MDIFDEKDRTILKAVLFIDKILFLLYKEESEYSQFYDNRDDRDSQVQLFKAIETLRYIRVLLNSESRYRFLECKIAESLQTMFEELQSVVNRDNIVCNSAPLIQRLHNFLIMLINYLESAISQYGLWISKDEEWVYNSEDYYREKITKTELEKIKLEEVVNQLLKEQEKSENQKKDLETKQAELEKANHLIKTFKNELESRKKQNDATYEWESRIKNTFLRLENYLSPIKLEHARLNCMFWIFGCVIVITIVIIVLAEIKAYCMLDVAKSFPDFKSYLIVFLPVPIAGALLWAFIFQMNRAQRQMVVLSQYIHEIKYVEGLLLSINALSPNIDDAVKRINYFLDKMVNNHLDTRINGTFSEKRILQEEKKDGGMPYEYLLKILGEIKNIANAKNS